MGSSFSKVSFLSVLLVLCRTLLVSARYPSWQCQVHNHQRPFSVSPTMLFGVRGGAGPDATDSHAETEPSLDEKVYAAMQKLGMRPPVAAADDDDDDDNVAGDGQTSDCKDGVCVRPTTSTTMTTDSQDPVELANRLAAELSVASDLAMAAVGATATTDGNSNTRVLNEAAARDLIQQELDLIDRIPSDAPHVLTLVEEGHDAFLARRALVYAENDIDDARAILVAELEDKNSEEEQHEKQRQQQEEQEYHDGINLSDVPPELIQVKGGDFDPTQVSRAGSPSTATTATTKDNNSKGLPPAAAKDAVVFEATTSQIQKLVLESPVPVLLDIYADWCGPCKVLGPALEDMAMKAGGMFRLVKVNSDNERPVSDALGVTALPTVYGIRDGKIVHMFQGMPKSEEMMKNFMMGLFGAAEFSPPVTSSELEKYEELTKNLMKTAGAASFSFSARERLTDRISAKLDDLVRDDSVQDVEGAATLMRTLLNNIIRHPFEIKYRTVKLDNKLIVSKIGTDNASCLAVLRSVGFAKQSPTELKLGGEKNVINIAPLVVARDCIDKWVQRNRAEMAAAARKRKDEIAHAQLLAEREAAGYKVETDEDNNDDDESDVDPTACSLKLRLDGKKKVHEVILHQDDPLSKVIEALNIDTEQSDGEIQITCVAKRLVVKSNDGNAMQKSLLDHGLMPAAALVIKIGSTDKQVITDTSSLKGRAAGRKERKKGSHTMQSIGIYAKDDNNKAELIDGGGGSLWEHDVSDDEEEQENESPDDGEDKQ